MMNLATDRVEDTLEARTEDSEAKEQGNPFIPMPNYAVLAVLFFGGAYALFVCVMALFNSNEEGMSMIGVALSSVWLIICTWYPFIRYKPDYGWCHPLVLFALLGILNLVL